MKVLQWDDWLKEHGLSYSDGETTSPLYTYPLAGHAEPSRAHRPILEGCPSFHRHPAHMGCCRCSCSICARPDG